MRATRLAPDGRSMSGRPARVLIASRSMGFKGLFVAAAIAAFAAAVSVALGASSIPPVNLLTVLAKPLASAERGKAPVLVPSRLNAGFRARHLYAAGGRSGDGYDIQLGAAPNCNDGDACFVAEFSAAKGTLGFSDRVTLSKGIVGRFHPISCGASCSPATVEWSQSRFLYTIQFGAGRTQLVALADSAISAGPR
jgi:hypothetical protein